MTDDQSLGRFRAPQLVVLNFSGGVQSSALAWMLLLGQIPKPSRLLILTADPGMESIATYSYVSMMQSRLNSAGLDARTVPGPSLYRDLIHRTGSRMDSPPYWTQGPAGTRGRLMQKCTREYKIRPMDREIRRYMRAEGIPLAPGVVEKWIGFARDEAHRIKPSRQEYVHFSYPLIDLGMRRRDVLAWYRRHDLSPPPRSVCNACYANGADHYRTLSAQDVAQAIRVDNAVRDMSDVGVTDAVYVSSTLRPLRDLAAEGFEDGQLSMFGQECESGYCFT